MTKLFEKISRLSFPTVLFIASFLTVVSVLPLWIYITTQKTQIASKAVEITPLIPSPTPTKPAEGPVPTNPPVITRVYPWVGKVGDEIVIEGKNFGTYPKNRRLAIADEIVSDSSISQWSDTQIVALIPSNPKQGGLISIRIDAFPIAESVPLVFYDENTTVRLGKTGNDIWIAGFTGTIKASLSTQNGKRETSVNTESKNQTTLFTLSPNEEIQTLLLTDDKGAYIPYSLNPTEFGF